MTARRSRAGTKAAVAAAQASVDRSGMPVAAACAAAGISETTFRRHGGHAANPAAATAEAAEAAARAAHPSAGEVRAGDQPPAVACRGFRGHVSVHGADTGVPPALFAAALDALPRTGEDQVILGSDKGMLLLRRATDRAPYGHVKFMPWATAPGGPAVTRVAALTPETLAEIADFTDT